LGTETRFETTINLLIPDPCPGGVTMIHRDDAMMDRVGMQLCKRPIGGAEIGL
jgi:hypothetical protein